MIQPVDFPVFSFGFHPVNSAQSSGLQFQPDLSSRCWATCCSSRRLSDIPQSAWALPIDGKKGPLGLPCQQAETSDTLAWRISAQHSTGPNSMAIWLWSCTVAAGSNLELALKKVVPPHHRGQAIVRLWSVDVPSVRVPPTEIVDKRLRTNRETSE